MKNLADALVKAQTEMPSVEKDAQNPHYKTAFTSLDQLIAETRPVLNRHGLAVVQLPCTNENGLPVLRTILLHGASGEQISADHPLMLAKNDMQGLGAAITYARRYAWAAALGIASEQDDDGNTAAVAAAEKPKPKPGPKMINQAQIIKTTENVKELDANATPIPPDFPGAESWVDVLRQRLTDEYGVETRKALTARQGDDLIAWLEAQKIPF